MEEEIRDSVRSAAPFKDGGAETSAAEAVTAGQ